MGYTQWSIIILQIANHWCIPDRTTYYVML
jgi:hypothetical protein